MKSGDIDATKVPILSLEYCHTVTMVVSCTFQFVNLNCFGNPYAPNSTIM